KEQGVQVQKAAEGQKKTVEVAQETKELRERVACLAEREKSLEHSVQQYYTLFTNNPQPMWVFDVHSLQILTVNSAAQAQYGFTTKEFMGRTARDLVPTEEIEAFLANALRPAHDGNSENICRQRRKDGSIFEAEIRAIDLKYADLPARL